MTTLWCDFDETIVRGISIGNRLFDEKKISVVESIDYEMWQLINLALVLKIHVTFSHFIIC